MIGVDPGLSGAIAIVEHSPTSASSPPRLVALTDFPLEEVNGKRRINVSDLCFWLDSFAGGSTLAVIEEVGVMTGKEGVVGMFRFGYAAGLVHGAIEAQRIPVYLTKPATWKMLMGLSRDKGLSRRRASEAFPEFAPRFARAKDDGRAEAALLALFGGRLLHWHK